MATLTTNRNIQLIQTVRARMNAARSRLAFCRSMAKCRHSLGCYKLWAKWMNRCKRAKRDMVILAEYLHTLLYAVGATKVYRKPTSGATAREIFEAVYPGKVHFLHQAQ